MPPPAKGCRKQALWTCGRWAAWPRRRCFNWPREACRKYEPSPHRRPDDRSRRRPPPTPSARVNFPPRRWSRACLDRIAAREDEVQAWEHLDPDLALAQARDADAALRAGEASGPLHGVPVGVKDIIDTADMPTENGSPIFTGRRPDRDAPCVAALRSAGAVIMGKTVTTEFAAAARRPRRATRTISRTRRAARRPARPPRSPPHGARRARQPDSRLDHPARRRSAASTASSRRSASFRAPAC